MNNYEIIPASFYDAGKNPGSFFIQKPHELTRSVMQAEK